MRGDARSTEGIPFVWHTFDMRPELPPNWRDDILHVVRMESVSRVLIAASVTSREASGDTRVPVRIEVAQQ